MEKDIQKSKNYTKLLSQYHKRILLTLIFAEIIIFILATMFFSLYNLTIMKEPILLWCFILSIISLFIPVTFFFYFKKHLSNNEKVKRQITHEKNFGFYHKKHDPDPIDFEDKKEHIQDYIKNILDDILKTAPKLLKNNKLTTIFNNFLKENQNKINTWSFNLYIADIKKPYLENFNKSNYWNLWLDIINNYKTRNKLSKYEIEVLDILEGAYKSLYQSFSHFYNNESIYSHPSYIFQFGVSNEELLNYDKNSWQYNLVQYYKEIDSFYDAIADTNTIDYYGLNYPEIFFVILQYHIIKLRQQRVNELSEILSYNINNNLTITETLNEIYNSNKKDEIEEFITLLYGKYDMPTIIENGKIKYTLDDGLSFLDLGYCDNNYYIQSSNKIIKEFFDKQKKKIYIENLSKGTTNKTKTTISDIDLMSGIEFEKYISRLFQSWGYKSHTTQETNDQGVDVIAEKNGVKIAIQTKCYNGVVGNSAIQEIVAGMKFYDADKAMVITNSTFTKSAIELAKKNNVQLWDRKTIIEKID